MSFRSLRFVAVIATGVTAIGLAPAQSPAQTSAQTSTTSTSTPQLVVHVDRPGAKIDPMFYGLMTEEINHAYDGGLYAELIQNRTFQDPPNPDRPHDPVHWALVQSPGGSATMTVSDSAPVNPRSLPVSLKLEIPALSKGARAGVANDGFWGIPVAAHTTYRVSLYARASKDFTGPLTVAIEDTTGVAVASGVIPKITTTWRKYTVSIKTGQRLTSSGNRFVISATRHGTVWLSLVSLFPPTYHNRPNGNRIDLMRMLAELHPAFLRLPGGWYLQGRSMAQRFDWKKMIGPVEDRPGHPGPWGYRSSDGLGLTEFLHWCDELHMEPVLGVFGGFTIDGEQALPGAALEPYVQEALDEIEYFTGGPETVWGRRRVQDGHPAPVPLRYVEIGNEEHGERYEQRFAQFYDAIKAKYPKLQIIATAHVTSRRPDVFDDHYYESDKTMPRIAQSYDTVSRTGPKIFVGEWATRLGGGRLTSTLQETLSDAAFLLGLERNADIIIMTAYAPLFVNVNPDAAQWATNLIGYDAIHAFGSASYYMQRMFQAHRGTQVLPVDLPDGMAVSLGDTTRVQTFFAVASRNSVTGDIILKVVNRSSDPTSVRIVLSGARSVDRHATAEVLSGELSDENTITAPPKIVPRRMDIRNAGTSFTQTFLPRSVNVIVFKTRRS